jgi:hypothetical protein
MLQILIIQEIRNNTDLLTAPAIAKSTMKLSLRINGGAVTEHKLDSTSGIQLATNQLVSVNAILFRNTGLGLVSAPRN